MSESEKNLKKFVAAFKDFLKTSKLSAKKIGACAEYAFRVNDTKAEEVTKRILKEINSCSDSKRLGIFYIIDAILGKCQRKLEDKNAYPKLLQSKLDKSFDHAAYCSSSEKKQIGKVLSKWHTMKIFSAKTIDKWAKRCSVEVPGLDLGPSNDNSDEHDKDQTTSISSANNGINEGAAEATTKRPKRTRWSTPGSTEKQIPASTAPVPPTERPAQPRPPAISLDIGINSSKTDEKRAIEITTRPKESEPVVGNYSQPGDSQGQYSQHQMGQSQPSGVSNSGWGSFSKRSKPAHGSGSSQQPVATGGGWGQWSNNTPGASKSPNSTQSKYGSNSGAASYGGWSSVAGGKNQFAGAGRGIPKPGNPNPSYGGYNQGNPGYQAQSSARAGHQPPSFQGGQQHPPPSLKESKPKSGGWGAFKKS